MARITKDMTIADVLAVDRGTAAIFMQYGMHCIGCPVSSSETVEQAGAVHDVDVDELIDALNDYLESVPE
ncbi:MAG: DUF1858 domain-containing protein [Clostridiales bacterium]|nr:DUF1858 domain-containing protein [Clostridiales bacterium]